MSNVFGASRTGLVPEGICLRLLVGPPCAPPGRMLAARPRGLVMRRRGRGAYGWSSSFALRACLLPRTMVPVEDAAAAVDSAAAVASAAAAAFGAAAAVAAALGAAAAAVVQRPGFCSPAVHAVSAGACTGCMEGMAGRPQGPRLSQGMLVVVLARAPSSGAPCRLLCPGARRAWANRALPVAARPSGCTCLGPGPRHLRPVLACAVAARVGGFSPVPPRSMVPAACLAPQPLPWPDGAGCGIRKEGRSVLLIQSSELYRRRGAWSLLDALTRCRILLLPQASVGCALRSSRLSVRSSPSSSP